MSEEAPIRITRCSRLSAAELAAVSELAAICNAYEQLDLKLDLDVLSPENSTIPAAHALAYRSEVLIGFATVTLLDEFETCGMVHPSVRRCGVGTTLLAEMRAAARGQQRTVMLALAEENSRSGQAFVRAQGGVLSFAEHRMMLDRAGLRLIDVEGIALRRATPADLGSIAALRSAAFGEPETEARVEVTAIFAASQQALESADAPSEYYLLAEREGRPIATLRVIAAGEREYVYGFGVLPAEQGRHLGRAVLGRVASDAFGRGVSQMALEVATTNERALRAYRACGFRVVTTYGYYRVLV